MSGQRELSQSILQVLFSIFLGLVVVAFVGIGVNTVYPQPGRDGEWTSDTSLMWEAWRLNTGVALLLCATVVMAISLLRVDEMPVLNNGVLLGGLFTMIYGTGMVISAGSGWPRFAAVTFALIVSLAVGWWRFTRGRAAKPVVAGAADTGPLAERLDAIEARLDSVGRAFRGE